MGDDADQQTEIEQKRFAASTFLERLRCMTAGDLVCLLLFAPFVLVTLPIMAFFYVAFKGIDAGQFLARDCPMDPSHERKWQEARRS